MSVTLRYLPRQGAASRAHTTGQCLVHYYSTRRFGVFDAVETDECGIPFKPTWSVNDLLSSYPKPSISPSQLNHLHELSALLPPEEGSAEQAALAAEMEDLAKLVEAVRIPDLRDEPGDGVPDGRIWVEGMGLELTETKGENSMLTSAEVRGRDLLAWAPRTSNEMYVVDTDRRKK
ncbi:hypothetical protein OE88DRAFT_1731748 [Heliocybe sulcata]|uniref:Uncharacterized protein n=1 Tax=Heliocybe sulcata TaxID=5364 RepID=A0A5C3NJ40_9AGAM|nr:hypothetical protein OE88DRAFT_1731748 [Heliocybe sulcata]